VPRQHAEHACALVAYALLDRGSRTGIENTMGQHNEFAFASIFVLKKGECDWWIINASAKLTFNTFLDCGT